MSDDIPSPANSGSDGKQKESEVSGQEVARTSSIRELPIADAIQGITSINSRAFGSETSTALLTGIARHYTSELQRERDEVQRLRVVNEGLARDVSDYKEKVGRLEERIAAYASQRHLKNAGVAVGSFLLSYAINSFIEKKYGLGAAASSIGLVLLVLVWFSSPKGGRE